MLKKIDMDYVVFEVNSTIVRGNAEPDDNLNQSSLVIKTYFSSDDEDDGDTIKVATVKTLSMHNYEERIGGFSLFDCFDAHSQLACTSFELVNSAAGGETGIIDDYFSDRHPLVLVTRLDIEDEFKGQEVEIISLMVDALKRQFGSGTFCFGLAPELMSYDSNGAVENRSSILEALNSNGFTVGSKPSRVFLINDASPFWLLM